MTEVVRPYRGVSADERRAERRTRLLEACLDLVGEVGVTDVTAEAVAARAGLSKRYFYESFADRDALLLVASDGVFEGVRRAIVEDLARSSLSLQERIDHTVTTLVTTLTADPRAARLYTEAPRVTALEQRRLQAFDEFTPLIAGEVLGAEPDDPRAYAAALLVVAGTTEVLARWIAGDVGLDKAGVVDTISRIGLAVAMALQ